jgi:hypothetical protein
MGSYDCPTGNCHSGTSGIGGSGVNYYSPDTFPGAANPVLENRTRAGYAPAFTPNELGSGVHSNAELELPPMYGR